MIANKIYTHEEMREERIHTADNCKRFIPFRKKLIKRCSLIYEVTPFPFLKYFPISPWLTASEVLEFLNPSMFKKFLEFGISVIEKDKVTLNPSLIK